MDVARYVLHRRRSPSIQRHRHSTLCETGLIYYYLCIRKPPRHQFHAQDIANRPRQLLAIINQVLTTLSISWGMGKHVDTLSSQDIIMSLKYIWFAQCTQLLVICLGKLAVVAYLATFHGPSYTKIKRALLWTIGSVQFAAGVVNIIIIFTQCSPRPNSGT